MVKDVSYGHLIDAIRVIAAGQTLFQPAITDRPLREAASAVRNERTSDGARDRTRAVLRALEAGRL